MGIRPARVIFHGGEGNDTAHLIGSDGNERAELKPGSGSLLGDSFFVSAGNVESITVEALNGDDRVDFYDSPGADSLVATPHDASACAK